MSEGLVQRIHNHDTQTAMLFPVDEALALGPVDPDLVEFFLGTELPESLTDLQVRLGLGLGLDLVEVLPGHRAAGGIAGPSCEARVGIGVRFRSREVLAGHKATSRLLSVY